MSKSIPLTQGLFTIVDDEDYEFLNQFKWYAWDNHGYGFYAAGHPDGEGSFALMHNLLLVRPLERHTDHRDGDGLNNQKANLRIVTNQQNQWNCRRQKNCKSRYKGVHWHSSRLKWQVDCGGKYCGLYASEIEAAIVYNGKARELYGEYARLNEV